jgi:hypothetical protein
MDRLPARLPSVTNPSEQTQWYVVRLRDFGFGGPLPVDGLKAAIEAGTLAWTDIAYVEDGAVGVWKRLFEIEALKKLLPALPDPARLKKFAERANAKSGENAASSRSASGWIEHLSAYAARVPKVEWSSPRYWYLLLDGKEVGPVEISQIDEVSKLAKIPASAYGWHVSMRRWKPLAEIPELSKFVGKASSRAHGPELSLVIERGSQKRRSTRRSLVAAVFQIRPNGQSEMIGVCGDVSPDGFQLHQHGRTVDYITGTRLDLEIRGSKRSQITNIRVSAVVKWFDPVKKIVGLEFVTLDSVDRKLLEKFTNVLV